MCENILYLRYDEHFIVGKAKHLSDLSSVLGVVGVRIGIDTNADCGGLVGDVSIVEYVFAEVIRSVDRSVDEILECVTVAGISSVLPLGGLRVHIIYYGDPWAVIFDHRY